MEEALIEYRGGRPLPFSDAQNRFLSTFSIFSAAPSWIGSGLIIYVILKERRSLLKKSYHRIMLGLSSCDFLFSFSLTVLGGVWKIPRTASYFVVGARASSHVPCSISGSFFFSSLGSSLYTMCLTLYFVLTVHFGWQPETTSRIEPLMHLVSWALPLYLAQAHLRNQELNPSFSLPGVCLTTTFPPFCRPADNFDCLRGPKADLTAYLVWSALAFVVICISLGLLIWTVRRTELAMRSYAGGRLSRNALQQTKATSLRALTYIMAYFLFSIPMVLLFWSNKDNFPKPSLAFYYSFQVLVLGVNQGFFNAIIYFRPRFGELTRRGGTLEWLGPAVRCFQRCTACLALWSCCHCCRCFGQALQFSDTSSWWGGAAQRFESRHLSSFFSSMFMSAELKQGGRPEQHSTSFRQSRPEITTRWTQHLQEQRQRNQPQQTATSEDSTAEVPTAPTEPQHSTFAEARKGPSNHPRRSSSIRMSGLLLPSLILDDLLQDYDDDDDNSSSPHQSFPQQNQENQLQQQHSCADHTTGAVATTAAATQQSAVSALERMENGAAGKRPNNHPRRSSSFRLSGLLLPSLIPDDLGQDYDDDENSSSLHKSLPQENQEQQWQQQHSTKDHTVVGVRNDAEIQRNSAAARMGDGEARKCANNNHHRRNSSFRLSGLLLPSLIPDDLWQEDHSNDAENSSSQNDQLSPQQNKVGQQQQQYTHDESTGQGLVALRMDNQNERKHQHKDHRSSFRLSGLFRRSFVREGLSQLHDDTDGRYSQGQSCNGVSKSVGALVDAAAQQTTSDGENMTLLPPANVAEKQTEGAQSEKVTENIESPEEQKMQIFQDSALQHNFGQGLDMDPDHESHQQEKDQDLESVTTSTRTHLTTSNNSVATPASSIDSICSLSAFNLSSLPSEEDGGAETTSSPVIGAELRTKQSRQQQQYQENNASGFMQPQQISVERNRSRSDMNVTISKSNNEDLSQNKEQHALHALPSLAMQQQSVSTLFLETAVEPSHKLSAYWRRSLGIGLQDKPQIDSIQDKHEEASHMSNSGMCSGSGSSSSLPVGADGLGVMLPSLFDGIWGIELDPV